MGARRALADEAVEAEYGPCIDGADPTELFVIETDGRPVGFIQRYRISDNPTWAAALVPAPDAAIGACGRSPAGWPVTRRGSTERAGFDYAIGAIDATGRGVGTAGDPRLGSTRSSVIPTSTGSWWRCSRRTGRRGGRWNGSASYVVGPLPDSPDPSDAGPSYIYALVAQPRRLGAPGISPVLR